jgi:hypothetical protein
MAFNPATYDQDLRTAVSRVMQAPLPELDDIAAVQNLLDAKANHSREAFERKLAVIRGPKAASRS